MTSKRNAALEAISAQTKLPAKPTPESAGPPREQSGRVAVKPSKTVAKVMLYVHPKVARKFKEIAFTEDRKANDVYLDALDAFLHAQGHGGLKGVIER
jgi:hypothetical protein